MFGFNSRPLCVALLLVFQPMLLGVPLTLFVLGYDGNDALTVESATTLEVDPSSVSLVKGDSVQMKAVPRSSRGDAVRGYEIIWASENDTFAMVDADSTVVAQNFGSTTITAATAEQGGLDSPSGQSSVTVERPLTRSLEVGTSTSGEDVDSDGYNVVVDDSTSQDISLDGSVNFSGLSEGDRDIELSGIQSNCSVDGENPRTVFVNGGDTAATSFSVSCIVRKHVGLYDVFEIQVTNDKTYSNPFDFNEVELQATFTAPSGETTDFFGFYAGDGDGGQTGNVWKLRFMPDEVGTWTYSYSWTDGTLGGSGSFEVKDTGLSGPLRVADENSWYFETSRGNPHTTRQK